MVATILVLIVAARCAIKRLTNNDILCFMDKGTMMQVFYVAVAASVVYIVYQMTQTNSYNLPTMYARVANPVLASTSTRTTAAPARTSTSTGPK